MQREIELKLTYAPAALRRLRRAPALRALRAGRGRNRHLVSTYFDTPDGAIAARGLTLRVRAVDGGWLQTVKREAERHVALGGREEWEVPIAGDRPDPRELAAPGLKDLFAGIDLSRLAPVFTTTVRRTTWPLRAADGSLVELALDEGEIQAGDKRAALAEAELELKQGSPASVFELAALLHDAEPGRIESRSKSARGYALALDLAPKPVKARMPRLTPDMTVAEAFVVIAISCLVQIEANEPVAQIGRDPEGVHQMRVATRRLRSAFRIFRDVLPPSAYADFRGELRWLAGELAVARDWDVFLDDSLEPVVAALPDEPGLAVLANIGQTLRYGGYRQVGAVLANPRFAALKIRLGGFLAKAGLGAGGLDEGEGDAARRDLLARPAVEMAGRLLRRQHRKFLGAGSDHPTFTLAELHALRIRAKQLRYTADFFRAFYRRKPHKVYVAALSVVQESLGGVNDAAVGRQRLDEAAAHSAATALGVAESLGLQRADGLVTGWQAARMQYLLAGFAAAWRAYASAKPFWRKALAAKAPAFRRAPESAPDPES